LTKDGAGAGKHNRTQKGGNSDVIAASIGLLSGRGDVTVAETHLMYFYNTTHVVLQG
jgi:hypothetical protein